MKQVVKKKRAEANNVSNEKDIFSLLIDGNSLLKMSLVDKRMNANGEEYGAVFLFLRQLGQLLQKKDFNHCIVCYDGYGSGVLRYNIYPEYKANRDKHYNLIGNDTEYDKNINAYVQKVLRYSNSKRKTPKYRDTEDEDKSFQNQRTILQNILENLFVRQYMYDMVEGDDLIAYYVLNKKENEKVVIVSGDRDLTQLIRKDVILYNPRKKEFITQENSVEKLGITHENIVLEKMICGDASDNIKGIKGMGESTLLKLFPELISEKSDINAVVERSKQLLSERKEQKKKPLKTLENIVNSVTDGVQGKDIYEINRKIIDLSEPLLTEDAKKELDAELYAPLTLENRTITDVYKIIEKNGMSDLFDEHVFGNLFGMFERIVKMEQRYAKGES